MDKNELYKVAGSKLRDIRKGTGLSVFKVGRNVGVSGNYISQIERGDRPASDAVLIGLSELYSVDKGELFSLYSKLPNEEVNLIMQNPALRQLFMDVTNDKIFDPEKMSKVIDEFKSMAAKYYTKGE